PSGPQAAPSGPHPLSRGSLYSPQAASVRPDVEIVANVLVNVLSATVMSVPARVGAAFPVPTATPMGAAPPFVTTGPGIPVPSGATSKDRSRPPRWAANARFVGPWKPSAILARPLPRPVTKLPSGSPVGEKRRMSPADVETSRLPSGAKAIPCGLARPNAAEPMNSLRPATHTGTVGHAAASA